MVSSVATDIPLPHQSMVDKVDVLDVRVRDILRPEISSLLKERTPSVSSVESGSETDLTEPPRRSSRTRRAPERLGYPVS